MAIVFSYISDNLIANKVAANLSLTRGNVTIRHFPDSESYVKLNSDVNNEDVIIVVSLDYPDKKIMALLFFIEVAKEYGAKSVGLVCPYLGYMRQDKRFYEGEAISSNIFAKFLSHHVDWLLSVDPHLHRHKSLAEIYSIPTKVVHAAPAIAAWINKNVENPVLIGPDEESTQWVSDVSRYAGGVPFVILEKIRRGDSEVQLAIHDIDNYLDHTPIILDDIISTAQTMIEAAHHVFAAGMKPPICIGVHPIFAANSYQTLLNAPISSVLSCNSIFHISNGIDISDLVTEGVKDFLKKSIS